MKKEEILSISQKLEELYFSLRQAETEGKLSGRDDRVQLKEDEKEAIQKVLNFLEQNPDLASDTGLSDVDSELQNEVKALVQSDCNLHLHRLNVIRLLWEKYNKQLSQAKGDPRRLFNSIVREYLGVSDRYARYYVAISNDAVPELKDLLVGHQIPVKEASWLSQKDKQLQRDVVMRIRDGEKFEDVKKSL